MASRSPDDLASVAVPTDGEAPAVAALRSWLSQAIAALPAEASDLELTTVARRYVADARNRGVSLETTLALYREVFAVRFGASNPIIARLRCERIAGYIAAAYRWTG
jgi:hypothetical protein